MLPNLAVLEKKCRALGLEPKASGKRLSKDDCVKLLREVNLPEGGLPYVELTPMLCFAEWNLKPEEQAKIWKSPTWVAQKKLNGCRLIMHFVQGCGVYAHSRTISVKTFRMQELSKQFLFSDFVPNFSATIDCEVIVEKPINTVGYTAKGELTKTSLHSTTSLLHLEAEASKRVQRDQNAPLIVMPFDITSIEGRNLRKERLADRLKSLALFEKVVKSKPELAPYFTFPPVVYENKREFYEQILKEGGEGVVLKNLNSPYHDSSSRPRDGWVKVKKRIEFDAFVTGFIPGEEKAGWSHLIGAFEFSVNLKDGGRHVIGYASNMTMEQRQAATLTVDGKPTLHPHWLLRVAEISGQDISAREMRLSHCTVDRWRFEDNADRKDAADCITDLKDLQALSSWVA